MVLVLQSAFGFNQLPAVLMVRAAQSAIRFRKPSVMAARGLFSNDAGNGTTPGMHASANVKHPVNQGLSGMLGVFTTTIVVCSCTAFCILLSGELGSGATGIQLTQQPLLHPLVNSASGSYSWPCSSLAIRRSWLTSITGKSMPSGCSPRAVKTGNRLAGASSAAASSFWVRSCLLRLCGNSMNTPGRRACNWRRWN